MRSRLYSGAHNTEYIAENMSWKSMTALERIYGLSIAAYHLDEPMRESADSEEYVNLY